MIMNALGKKELVPQQEVLVFLVIRNISLGKHVVRKCLQLRKGHVFYGMFYLAHQFVTLEIIVIA